MEQNVRAQHLHIDHRHRQQHFCFAFCKTFVNSLDHWLLLLWFSLLSSYSFCGAHKLCCDDCWCHVGKKRTDNNDELRSNQKHTRRVKKKCDHNKNSRPSNKTVAVQINRLKRKKKKKTNPFIDAHRAQNRWGNMRFCAWASTNAHPHAIHFWKSFVFVYILFTCIHIIIDWMVCALHLHHVVCDVCVCVRLFSWQWNCSHSLSTAAPMPLLSPLYLLMYLFS